jgi:hypothetical protein
MRESTTTSDRVANAQRPAPTSKRSRGGGRARQCGGEEVSLGRNARSPPWAAIAPSSSSVASGLDKGLGVSSLHRTCVFVF